MHELVQDESHTQWSNNKWKMREERKTKNYFKFIMNYVGKTRWKKAEKLKKKIKVLNETKKEHN